MNARRFRYSNLLPLVLVFALACETTTNADASSDVISIVTELSESPVAYDGRVRVDVSVEWTGAADRYIAAWPEIPSLDGLRVVGSRQETASWVKNGAQISRQTFTWIVAPERIGVAHVGVVETVVRDATTGDTRRISTAPVPVEVVRATEGGRFRWSQVVYGSIALVCLVFVAGWIRARTRRRIRKRHERISAHEQKLTEKLRNLRRARESGDVSAFYDGVFSALRSIIALRFIVRTDGMSTDDLLHVVENASIDENERTAYVNLLRDLDRRRYAAEQENVNTDEMMGTETLLRLAAVLIREERDVG